MVFTYYLLLTYISEVICDHNSAHAKLIRYQHLFMCLLHKVFWLFLLSTDTLHGDIFTVCTYTVCILFFIQFGIGSMLGFANMDEDGISLLSMTS